MIREQFIELNWYKIGYENYNKFLARKQVCYSGKKITFQWNQIHYQNALITFAPYYFPRENVRYIEYLKYHFS